MSIWIILVSFYYLSTPGLSWDAMLKTTKTKLEPITELIIYIF